MTLNKTVNTKWLAIGGIIISTLFSSESASPQQSSLIGTWRTTINEDSDTPSVSIIKFNKDGTYSEVRAFGRNAKELRENRFEAYGHYKLKGKNSLIYTPEKYKTNDYTNKKDVSCFREIKKKALNDICLSLEHSSGKLGHPILSNFNLINKNELLLKDTELKGHYNRVK